MSPEEDNQINIAVSLSGMTKQEYITHKLLDRTINVKANCKVHRAVYDRFSEVLEQLEHINSEESLDDELIKNISLITRMVDDLYHNKLTSLTRIRLIIGFLFCTKAANRRQLFFCSNCNTFCNTGNDKENNSRKSTLQMGWKWLKIELK